jgi:hypothetical protein
MLTDVANVTKSIDVIIAAKAKLASGLVWSHIGENHQARGTLTEAEKLSCTDTQFLDILHQAKAHLMSAKT